MPYYALLRNIMFAGLDMGERYDLTLPEADYPQWNGPPCRTVIVCAMLRSGSTLLGEGLYFAGGVGCALEYFHGSFRDEFAERWHTHTLRDYAAELIRRRTEPLGSLATKMFWTDLLEIGFELVPDVFCSLKGAPPDAFTTEHHCLLYKLLTELLPNPVFVHLMREDDLRQAVSNYVGEQNNRWRKFAEPKNLEGEQVLYSFDGILRNLVAKQRSNRLWLDFLHHNALPRVTVMYEDLERDYDGTMRTVLASLGRPEAPIRSPRLQKQRNEKSEELRTRFLSDFKKRTGAIPNS